MEEQEQEGEEEEEEEGREGEGEGGEEKGIPSSPGLTRILAFISKYRPKTTSASTSTSSTGTDTHTDNEKSWHEIQMEPTPTLLPEMRFHDLVFGHELGSGAFSTGACWKCSYTHTHIPTHAHAHTQFVVNPSIKTLTHRLT